MPKDNTSQNQEAIIIHDDNVEQDGNESVVSRASRDNAKVGNEKRGATNLMMPQGAPRKNRGRGGQSSVELNIEKHLKQASNVLHSLNNDNTTTTKNETDLYAQLLAAKLTKLPKTTQLLLKHKIDTMLFEAQLDEELKLNTSSPISIINDGSACTPSPINTQISCTSTSTPTPAASPQAALLEFLNFEDVNNDNNTNNDNN